MEINLGSIFISPSMYVLILIKLVRYGTKLYFKCRESACKKSAFSFANYLFNFVKSANIANFFRIVYVPVIFALKVKFLIGAYQICASFG